MTQTPTRLRPLSLCFVYCFGPEGHFVLVRVIPIYCHIAWGLCYPEVQWHVWTLNDWTALACGGAFHCTLKGPRQQDLVPGLERVTAVPLFLKLIWNKNRDLKDLLLYDTKHLYLHSLYARSSRFPANPIKTFAPSGSDYVSGSPVSCPWTWVMGSERRLVCHVIHISSLFVNS